MIMYRPDPDTSEAPNLKQFFTELSQGTAVNYCAVCLRTQNETKLVKNNALKQFTKAMKITKNWRHYLICYMCERQAEKALNFFNAATFAAAIDTIFSELIYQKIKMKVNVFHKDNFKDVLKKFGLTDISSSPADWEVQLNAIRQSTKWCRTETVVVENSSDTNPITVFPVEGAQLYPMAQATYASAARNKNSVRTRQFANEANMTGSAKSDSFMLGLQNPNITETFVILDDEEDLDIRIEKVESRAQMESQTTASPVALHTAPTQLNMNTIPVPTLVPIQNHIRTQGVFPTEGFLVTSNGNYLIHQVPIQDGAIIKPNIPIANTENQTFQDIQEVIIQQPSKSPIYCEDSSEAVINLDNETEIKEELTDEATPSKQTKMLPAAQSAVPDGNARIDWEDKIPMDVISFVDALDPNRDQILAPQRAALGVKYDPQKKPGASRSPPQFAVQDGTRKYNRENK